MVDFILEIKTDFETMIGMVVALALCLVVTVIAVLQFRIKKSNYCANPSCVRCQCYRHIESRAIRRLPWVAREVQHMFPNESLDRISESIRHSQHHHNYRHHHRHHYQNIIQPLQAPTVLMCRNLPSREVVTDLHAQTLNQYFRSQKMGNTILMEVNEVPLPLWSRNDSPTGSWDVLWILNQGHWNQQISTLCPRLWGLLRNLPSLLDNCLFGNAMISKIQPGTIIEPHCGPTNIRHRLQYTLMTSQTSTSSFLQIGKDTKIPWGNPGNYFVFDDSYIHSIRYDDPTQDRMVIIVDLWHPDLSHAERALLRFLYPPFSSRYIT